MASLLLAIAAMLLFFVSGASTTYAVEQASFVAGAIAAVALPTALLCARAASRMYDEGR